MNSAWTRARSWSRANSADDAIEECGLLCQVKAKPAEPAAPPESAPRPAERNPPMTRSFLDAPWRNDCQN